MASIKNIKAAVSGMGIGAATLDLGINAGVNMLGGDNLGTALIKAVPESIVWGVAPGIMSTIMAAQVIPAGVKLYQNWDMGLQTKYNKNHKGGTMFSYQDTNQAMTMRQAAVQAIQGSKLNARNALGGEAALMHRNWSDRM